MQTMSCIAAIEKNYTTGREVSIILARELDSHAQLHIKLWTTVNIEMVILCEFHSVITVNRTNADVHRTAINGCDLFHSLSSWLLRFSLVIVGDDDLNYLFNWFAHWYGLDKSIDSIYLVFAPPQWCVVLRKVVSPGIWYELGSCFLKEALDLFIEIVEFVRIKKCLWLSMRTPLFYLIYQFEHFVRTEIYPAVGAKLTQNTRHIISKTYQRGQHSRLPNRQQFNSMNHN